MTDTATARLADRISGFGSVLALAEDLTPAPEPAATDDAFDREFLALVAAAEMLAAPAADADTPDPSDPVATTGPPTRHRTRTVPWRLPAEPAPWRSGTLSIVAQIAGACGGVVSDELLDTEDRSRVFTRRLARAGQVVGRSYVAGRLEAPDLG
ncbi:MAG: hypothetical protein OXS29_13495 [bacterium]|nr:hypothetical protein [bacterium]MDE0289540.1 hypothetical protein [bacterium]MDE0437696.1 hypothetical protein [bacterium]